MAKPVRTTEEARALASLPRGPRAGREKVKRQVVLYADQAKELEQRSINKSELVRKLLDEWLARSD
ncbi:hypothetical protein [Deinococcus sp. Marseille-Q6407]|uniref:hypothetical protein n=1 Tax=Deinococcus sp. Marseille-Q6407 TaxID=2969223 RepID=UPI0021C22911|nr:hypothetical protein [Deinococcus sp. Marseille-Q6407]